MVSLVDLSLCHPRTSLSCLGYGRGRIPQPEKCPYRGQKDPSFSVVFSRESMSERAKVTSIDQILKLTHHTLPIPGIWSAIVTYACD